MADKPDKQLIVKHRGAARDVWAHFFSLVVFAFAFLIFLILLFVEKTDDDRLFVAIAAAAFGAIMLLHAFAFLRLTTGTTTVFDPTTRSVTIKRLLAKPWTLPFSQIAKIAEITEKSLFLERRAYCIVPVADPIQSTSILTTFYKPQHMKLERFRREALPRIEEMLGLGDPSRTAPSAVKNDCRAAGYERIGGRYTKTHGRRFFLRAALFTLVLLGGTKLLSTPDTQIMGVILCVLALIGFFSILFLASYSVAIDPSRKTIEVKKGMCGRTKTYSFEDVDSFVVGSFFGNWFLRNQRTLEVRFAGMKKTVPLVTVRNAQKSDKALAEFAFLSGLVERDLNAVVYVRRRIGNGLL